MKSLICLLTCTLFLLSDLARPDDNTSPTTFDPQLDSPEPGQKKLTREDLRKQMKEMKKEAVDYRIENRKLFSIGPEYSWNHYNVANYAVTDGRLFGGTLGLDSNFFRNKMNVSLQGSTLRGRMTEDFLKHNPNIKSKTYNRQYFAKVTIGYNALLGAAFLLRPYLGFNYMRWDYDVLENGGYLSVFQRSFLPIGTEFRFYGNDLFYISLIPEYDVFVYGRVRNYIDNVNAAQEISIQRYRQPGPDQRGYLVFEKEEEQRGSGYRISLRLFINFGPVGASVEPYYQVIKIEESVQSYRSFADPDMKIVYPANEYKITGIKFLLHF